MTETDMRAQARVTAAGVSEHPLDVEALAAGVSDDKAGATVTFTGVVRNHDAGRGVTEIEYVAHPAADQIVRDVAADFADREGVHAICVVHRVGVLQVGDVALAVSVAASHRKEAFGTAADIVDRVKEVLPVWKRQLYTDGTHHWTGCP